jgi:sugar phosphate isomerase/epimerase
LHAGSIEMKDYTDKLIELAGRGEKESVKYEKLCKEADQKREARKEPFVERMKETLKKLSTEAESKGLKLGLENRQALEELPLESDYQFLFRELTSPNLIYWHDTGHAQIKENLGFIRHAMHLESLRDRLGGFHIHDVEFPGRDHTAPGTGSVDFSALKPFVKPEHIKVFEFGPGLTAEQARAGIEHVKAIWGRDSSQ